MNNKKALWKVLKAAGASLLQCRMAAILLAVNGLDNALEFASVACKHPRQLDLPGMEGYNEFAKRL